MPVQTILTGTFCKDDLYVDDAWSKCLIPMKMDADSVAASVKAVNAIGDSIRSDESGYAEMPIH